MSGRFGQIEAYEYPAMAQRPESPDWVGWDEAEEEARAQPQAPLPEAAAPDAGAAVHAEWEERLAEAARRAFDAGLEQGRALGLQAEREAHAAWQAAAEQKRLEQMAALAGGFARARDGFLEEVEREVVELALAVAARILRREAQMDPLLLTGAVRVALGQLGTTAKVRLLVPGADLDLWREAIALLPNLTLKPEAVAGEGMRLGECVLETEMGSVDLGVRAQMGEIERGFFDRTGKRRAESEDRAGGSQSRAEQTA